jgi:CRISPR/Cas system CSM-associated protein Csm2 small subunit
MALKTVNRTIDEVERLLGLVEKELSKINPDTLSDEEAERLIEAFSDIVDFHDFELVGEYGDEDRGDEEGEDHEA